MTTPCINHLSYEGLRSVRCNRPATGDDKLCNVCRAAKKRGAKVAAANDAKRAREAIAVGNAERLIAHLEGAPANAVLAFNWSSGKYSTDRVTVDLAWLLIVAPAP